jgi:NitT/TauT family transport system substrate-binding protein
VAEFRKVVSEYSGIVFSLPWLVARDEGIFREFGLDVELVRARGAANNANQPVDGTVQQFNANDAVTDPEKVKSILGHGLFEEGKVQMYRA